MSNGSGTIYAVATSSGSHLLVCRRLGRLFNLILRQSLKKEVQTIWIDHMNQMHLQSKVGLMVGTSRMSRYCKSKATRVLGATLTHSLYTRDVTALVKRCSAVDVPLEIVQMA